MVVPPGVGCTAVPGPGRADLHMHTTASDGWPVASELVDYASALDLDVIAVTDHDTIEGALRAADYAASRAKKLHVVVGEEVSSRDGHIVGLFLERRVRPGMSAAATVHAIHDQGGLAIAVHPFWRTQRRTRASTVHGVGWLAAELDFDGIEVENATPGFYVFNQLARRLNVGLGRAEIGGSDAHILDAVGRAFTEFPGRTPKALRTAIEKGRTSAGRRRYRAVGLMRYAAWGFNHERYVAVV
ncbi:MAG TPA: PHP domain-containing protein [Candidatus Dormibacteraeota bacterium]|nr:PHP domain-containing protein [Candidatus Dormibacteraeota bacterium]